MKCSLCGCSFNSGVGWGESDYLCTSCSTLPSEEIEQRLADKSDETDFDEEGDSLPPDDEEGCSDE